MDNIIPKLSWLGIGSIITIICNELYKYYKEIVVKREFRRFWNFKNKQVTIVHPIYYGQKGEEMPPNMARIEDVLAMDLLTNSLKEIGVDYKLLDDQKEVPTDTDLVLICSPKGNKKSADFNDKHSMPFEFCNSPTNHEMPCIRDTNSGLQICSPVDMDKNNRQDVALLGRYTDNQLSRRVFLFWGIHGPGTLASIKFVMNKNNIKKNNKETKGQDFNTIIQAPFVGIREIGEVKEIVRLRIFTVAI